MLQFRRWLFAIHDGLIWGWPLRMVALAARMAIPVMVGSICLDWRWSRRETQLAAGLMAVLFAFYATTKLAHAHNNEKVIRSTGNGNWSEPATWDRGTIPVSGDIVLIQEGHHVRYDASSSDVLRAVHISGILEFARDADTRLEAGLIRIQSGNQVSEVGFDGDFSQAGHDHHQQSHDGSAHDGSAHDGSAALIVGSYDQPIHADRKAMIRLHYVEGMDANACPALVCCGGRMDLHGAPLRRTWVKLQRSSYPGERRVFLTESVDDWKPGDKLLVTATNRQDFSKNTVTDSLAEHSRTEEVSLAKQIESGGYPALELEQPLKFNHDAENAFRGEVANLSRNVVVESADPAGHRGHTMYHHGSSGSISYVEFRHLGKRGVLGRYSLHFHLVGDSMRGSSVIGASIWDSHNRWLTIHGTNYLVVHDCVGYRSIGHGFFLEDGTETLNVLDRNLAVLALRGEPLPDQVLPFDHNDGAGFWWANSHNSFTRNVAVECDTYGFRFEATNAGGFNPEQTVLLADGSLERRDLRSLPFIRFEDNEAHAQRFFGLNLRGMAVPQGLADFATVIPEGHIGPDIHHSMRIKNLTLWDTLWPYHAGMTGVDVDQLHIHRSTYGIWRSILDHHSFVGLRFSDISNHEIHQPITVPQIDSSGTEYYRFDNTPQDAQPPFSIVTGIRSLPEDRIEVSGVSIDNRSLHEVRIGKHRASVLDHYGYWQMELDRSAVPESGLPVRAKDRTGNAELDGSILLPPSRPSRSMTSERANRGLGETPRVHGNPQG